MRDKRHCLLGTLGEDLVCRLESCVKSNDIYDDIKDAIDSQGKTVEIKTQTRYIQKNIFSIRADKHTNVQKCMNVDRLIFVEFNNSNTIDIYECLDRKNYVRYTTSNGVPMIGWPIYDMIKLHSVVDKDLADKMRWYSNSKY